VSVSEDTAGGSEGVIGELDASLASSGEGVGGDAGEGDGWAVGDMTLLGGSGGIGWVGLSAAGSGIETDESESSDDDAVVCGSSTRSA